MFSAPIIGREQRLWLYYQFSPFHANSPLYPIVRHIERAAGFASEDTPEQKRDKLEVMLATAAMDLPETVLLFSEPLSIPRSQRDPPLSLNPAQRRRKTLEALLAHLERLTRHHPVVMMFEDTHWADARTLEFLDLLVERIRLLPVLVLVTHRPGFEVAWSCLDHVGVISLASLNEADIRSIIHEISTDRRLPSEVIAQIVRKTDGIPLFVEQLTKTVLESGALGADGASDRASISLRPIAIPATLRDSLMARLDRLESAKDIAHAGAVIGREFSQALLEAIIRQQRQQLEESLTRLMESGLIQERDSVAEKSYYFKHALIQDAAYETIAKSKRQYLHAAVAQAILDKFPDVAENQPEILAYHCSEARMTAEALGFWVNRAEVGAALSLAQQCLELAQKAGFGSDLANCLMGQTLSSMGEFVTARRHFQTVIDNFRAGMRDITDLFSVDEPVLALS